MPPSDHIIDLHPKSHPNNEKQISKEKRKHQPCKIRLHIIVLKLNFWIPRICHFHKSHYKAIPKEPKEKYQKRYRLNDQKPPLGRLNRNFIPNQIFRNLLFINQVPLQVPDLADRLINRVLDPDLVSDVVLDRDVLPDPGGWEEDQEDEENRGLDDDPVVGAKGDEDAGDEEHKGGLEGGQVDTFGGEGAPDDEENVSEADDCWVGPAEVLLVVGVSSCPAWNVDQNGVNN